jgi:hypothetical protein
MFFGNEYDYECTESNNFITCYIPLITLSLFTYSTYNLYKFKNKYLKNNDSNSCDTELQKLSSKVKNINELQKLFIYSYFTPLGLDGSKSDIYTNVENKDKCLQINKFIQKNTNANGTFKYCGDFEYVDNVIGNILQ